MADDNAIPVRIGHYEILKTIGEPLEALPRGQHSHLHPSLFVPFPALSLGKGNFAVVKLARHTITNLKVANLIMLTPSDQFNIHMLYLFSSFRWPSK